MSPPDSHGDVLTFTLEALSQQTPQQGPAVVTEGQDLEVVDAKLVRNVDAEPLRSDYLHQEKKDKKLI